MFDLTNRSILLTGVSGDIGQGYLSNLVRAGAKVLATDLRDTRKVAEEAVESANNHGPGRAIFFACDVTSPEQADAAVATAIENYGRLDGLVNNAAIYHALGPKRPLTALTKSDWESVLQVNVVGTWNMIRAAASPLAEGGGGRVVNIASTAARKGTSGFAHYVASKAAVEGLTRAAARELGGDGTTVNAVSPGLVDDAGSTAVNSGDYVQSKTASRSISRAMVPQDLASTVLWLLAKESQFVTGQTIIVDGGDVLA